MAGSPASWTTTDDFYTTSLTQSRMRTLNYVGNGDWLAAGYQNGTVSIFHTTDPRSTAWATVGSVAYTGTPNVFWEIVNTGSEYAFLTYQSSGTPKHEIVYASSPTGTWSTQTIGTVSAGEVLSYANGYFVIGGQRQVSGSLYKSHIWYSSSITGTWTGVDVSANTTGVWNGGPVRYENGYYYALIANGSNARVLYRSTSLSGTWSSYYEFTGYQRNGAYQSFDKYNDKWVVTFYKSGTNEQYIAYADTLDAASWTYYNIQADVSGFTTVPTDFAYGGGYYVIVGEAPSGSVGVAYSTAIGGPYTQGSAGTGYSAGIAYNDLEFVMLTRYGVKCMTGGALPPPPPVTPTYTYLRQRQSPVRTPSRVRGVDLRARQTTFIT